MEIVQCPGRISDGRCENVDKHMLKYKTGFCALGRCEGKKVIGTMSGKPQPTCSWWMRCPCKCHDLMDRMFSLSGEPRHLVDNSGYKPDRGDFVMPTAEERIAMHALSNPEPATAPKYIESPVPDLVPATVARSYRATATGRSARGELEAYVREVCDAWLVDKDYYGKSLCTPRFISEEIARDKGINQPSTGAVDAVLKRWERIGFAELATKPTRFVQYTPEGIRLGLDDLKAKAKRAEKSKLAARQRGVRV